MALEAPSPHHSGVVVFYREVGHFTLGGLCLYGPNVTNFQMVMGWQWCNILGCYIAPDKSLTIENTVAAIRRRP